MSSGTVNVGTAYQSSVVSPVVFNPQTMNQIVITAGAMALGASNTITIMYTTAVPYPSDSVVSVSIPGGFGVPALPSCSLFLGSTSIPGAACTITGGSYQLQPSGAGITTGSTIKILINDIINPLCLQSNYQFSLSTTSSSFDVEKASSSFSTVGFSMAALNIVSITQTATFSASLDNIVITISTNAIIVAGSYIQVTMPSTAIISASSTIDLSATNWGAATPTANIMSTTQFSITDGVLINRNPSPTDMLYIGVKAMYNPRGLGSFPVIVDIFSSDGCKYMSATGSIINDKIQMIQNAVLTIPASFRNTYQVYNFTVTPSSNSLSAGDMISIELPAGILLSSNPSCKSYSSNIQSVSCKKVSNTIIAMTPTINTAAYSLNKQLSFSVDKIRNPDSASAISGFNFRVTDASGTVYENYPSMSYTFSDYIVPNTSQAIFMSRRVGEVNITNLTIRVDTFLVENTKIIITFSDSFDLNQLITVNASSVLINATGVNSTSRQMVVSLISVVPANTSIEISLNMANPIVQSVQANDISVKVQTSDGFQIFSVAAIRADSPNVFACDLFCTSCRSLFSVCTDCQPGYALALDNTCKLNPIQSEYFPNYIFIGIGIALTLLMLFVGLICNCRNYWGNLLFAVLKVNFFAFCIMWGFTWMKNDIEFNIRIASYGIAGVHFTLTWIFFLVIRAASNCSKYQERFHRPDLTTIDASELHDEDSYHTELAVDSAFRYMFNSFMVFSLLFSTALVRWFFSEKGKRKGYFWYFEPKAFVNIRDALECYQILYILLFMVPFAGLNIYYLNGKTFSNWNKYMFEALLLCGLDLLAYLIAYCELANSRRKILEISQYSSSGQPKKTKEGLADGDQSFSKDKSAVLDETRKDEKSVLFDPNEKGRRDIKNPLLSASKSPTNGISSTLITTAPLMIHKSLDEDAEKNLKGEIKGLVNDKITLNQSDLPSIMFQPQKSGISLAKTIGDKSRLEDSTMKLQKSSLRPLTIYPQKKYSSISDAPKAQGLIIIEPLISEYQGKRASEEKQGVYASYPGSERVDGDKTGRQSFEMPPAEWLEQSAGQKLLGEMNTSPELVKDRNSGDMLLQYPSIKLADSLRHTSIFPPSSSRFKDNLRKRMKASGRQPLDIIYEEAENETPLLTPIHNLSSSGLVARETRLVESRKDLRRPAAVNMVNGQQVTDLERGNLLDRNNVHLNLRAQSPDDVRDGVYKDVEGRVIQMNTQEDGMIKRGLIQDVDANIFRVKDQDFEELKNGVYLRPDGTVDNVNGQKPIDVDNQELYDRAGNKLDLKKQNPDCFRKSQFKLENNPKPIYLGYLQNQDKFEIGIITAPDGKDYRIIDQYFDEIQNRGVYRNRNLGKMDFGLPESPEIERYQPRDLKDDGVESLDKKRPVTKDYSVVQPIGSTPPSTSRPNLKRQNTSRTEGNAPPVKHQLIEPIKTETRPYSAKEGKEDIPSSKRKPMIKKLVETEFSGIDDDEAMPPGHKNPPLSSLPNFTSPQYLNSPARKAIKTPTVATNQKPTKPTRQFHIKAEDLLDDARPVEKKSHINLIRKGKLENTDEWGKIESDDKLDATDSRDRLQPRIPQSQASKPQPINYQTPEKSSVKDFSELEDDRRAANKASKEAARSLPNNQVPNRNHDVQEKLNLLTQRVDSEEIPVKEIAAHHLKQVKGAHSGQTQIQASEQRGEAHSMVGLGTVGATKSSQAPHSKPSHSTSIQPYAPGQKSPTSNPKQQSNHQALSKFDPFQKKPPIIVAEDELTLLDKTPLWPSAMYRNDPDDTCATGPKRAGKAVNPPVYARGGNQTQQQSQLPNKAKTAAPLNQTERPVERAVDDELESRKSQQSRTMYLDLMMDESLDIDLNIEEVEDDRESGFWDQGDSFSATGTRRPTNRGYLAQGGQPKFVPKTRLAQIAHSNLGQDDVISANSYGGRVRVSPKDNQFIEEKLSRNSGDDVGGRNGLRRKKHLN